MKKDEVFVVRNVSKPLQKQLKKLAVEEGTTIGELLAEAVELLVKERKNTKKPDPKNFMKVIGMIKTSKPVKWSTEVDEILYGWKR